MLFERADAIEHTLVSSKGQMIIPKLVRQALGLKQGSELAVELLPEGGFAARPMGLDPKLYGGLTDTRPVPGSSGASRAATPPSRLGVRS